MARPRTDQLLDILVNETHENRKAITLLAMQVADLLREIRAGRMKLSGYNKQYDAPPKAPKQLKN